MRHGIHFPVEKERKRKAQGNLLLFYFSFFFLFNSCQWSERKKREGKQGMTEGERILWLILVVTLK
jgi:hypothetical protein